MRAKKIIASVMALTLLSGGVCGTNLFTTETLSALEYDLSQDKDISKDKKVAFDLSDSVVKPGEITYLDINISENTGFCTLFLKLEFDENVFSLASMSVLPEFTGKDYDFAYRIPTKNFIFMNDLHDNTKEIGTSIVRVALKVNEDAPEGDYTIGLEKGDNVALIAMTKDKELFYPEISCSSGTVTVNKEMDPKTNITPMSLGRVYAQMDSEIILNKTGDLTNDGSINVFDVQRLSQYLLGIKDTAQNGDTNEDGTVNAIDYLILKSYIIGE